MLGSFLTSLFFRSQTHAGTDAREDRYREVMQAYGESLLRVGIVYGFRGVDLEEVEQDIAVAIWEALPAWNSDASLRTYLFRVAHNTSIDRLRRAGRGPHPNVEATDNLSVTRLTPESQAIDRQALYRLQRALDALPLLQRQVITLSMEDLSTDEIADVLGIKNNYVHVLLHRTRATLKGQMEVENDD